LLLETAQEEVQLVFGWWFVISHIGSAALGRSIRLVKSATRVPLVPLNIALHGQFSEYQWLDSERPDLTYPGTIQQ
jgi:hypothetical protein